MRAVDIIQKKRDGFELTKEEIQNYIDNKIRNNNSLQHKFNIAYEKEIISLNEKEKWGY